MSVSHPEIVIIGAGIAGASAACELARTHRVTLLERESTPGYHSTSRSAALFSETYGNGPVRALSRASRDFFFSPPKEFAEHPLVKPRGTLLIAREDQASQLAASLEHEDVAKAVQRLSAAEALELCPILRPESLAAGALYEKDSHDVDVNALHQGYLRLFKHLGGSIVTNAEVRALERRDNEWTLDTTAGQFRAPIVVNAAGAWADDIAGRATVAPKNIEPRRRTAALVELPSGIDGSEWPMTIDIDETFYFKPDAGLLLVSPADETPTLPCDAQPEELDVAIAIDRVERATRLTFDRVRAKWAGLRSFAPDRSPVIGFDEERAGFFWLAAQGGYGIQTAPAACALTASLIRREPLPAGVTPSDVDSIAPGRFRKHTAFGVFK